MWNYPHLHLYVFLSLAHVRMYKRSYAPIKGVMNSACCLETCAEISMTELPQRHVNYLYPSDFILNN